jgi:AcrR family transcriptional regulator
MPAYIELLQTNPMTIYHYFPGKDNNHMTDKALELEAALTHLIEQLNLVSADASKPGPGGFMPDVPDTPEPINFYDRLPQAYDPGLNVVAAYRLYEVNQVAQEQLHKALAGGRSKEYYRQTIKAVLDLLASAI